MTQNVLWEAITGALKKVSARKASASGTSEKPLEPSQSIITDSDTSTKAEDLLAFRTIITMLSYVKSPNIKLPTKTPIATAPEDRRLLSVLDALSAVLIRQHEITAVVGKSYEHAVQVFVSVVYPGKAEPLLQSDAVPEEPSFWNRFTVGVNPRTSKINGKTDSLINRTKLPTIGDFQNSVPRDLVEAVEKNVPVLDRFLQDYW
jgi:hypothetical protein